MSEIKELDEILIEGIKKYDNEKNGRETKLSKTVNGIQHALRIITSEILNLKKEIEELKSKNINHNLAVSKPKPDFDGNKP